MNLEDFPLVSTMGVGWDAADEIAWQLHPPTPPGWIELTGGTPTAPVYSLGPPVTVTAGQVLPAGWHVLATATPIDDTTATAAAQLINSTGTTTCPAAGVAYTLSAV